MQVVNDQSHIKPLHLAAQFPATPGHFKIARLLVKDCGVDVNAHDWNQKTPLHYAVENDRLPLSFAQRLMDLGADPMITDKNGEVPFQMRSFTANERLDFPGIIDRLKANYVEDKPPGDAPVNPERSLTRRSGGVRSFASTTMSKTKSIMSKTKHVSKGVIFPDYSD